MVLLIITPNIRSALDKLPETVREQLSLPAPELDTPISHTQLTALSRKLSSYSFEANGRSQTDPGNEIRSYTLNDLVRGTRVYVPPAPPRPELVYIYSPFSLETIYPLETPLLTLPKSTEYVALMSKLEAEAQSRKYKTLLNHRSANHQPSIFSPSDTGNVPHSSALFDADADADADPLTPSLAVNVLITILFTGFATYWALSNFRIPYYFTFSTSRPGDNYPGSISSQPFRVFLSMFLAAVVGVAEVVVYAAYWRKAGAAKEKEKKVVEKKVVIGEYKGELDRPAGDTSVSVGTMEEKVEIWGKGVNGGARRRLIERWKGEDDAQ